MTTHTATLRHRDGAPTVTALHTPTSTGKTLARAHPAIWWDPAVQAWLIPHTHLELALKHLTRHGVRIIDERNPDTHHPTPPSGWCGQCDPRTRMIPTSRTLLARCPRCHPLGPLATTTTRAPDPQLPIADPATVTAGLAAIRAELAKTRRHVRAMTRQGNT